MCDMPADNDERFKRKQKGKIKPTGGGWSAQEKRMKQNQWYQGEPKALRHERLKGIKKKRKKK